MQALYGKKNLEISALVISSSVKDFQISLYFFKRLDKVVVLKGLPDAVGVEGDAEAVAGGDGAHQGAEGRGGEHAEKKDLIVGIGIA